MTGNRRGKGIQVVSRRRGTGRRREERLNSRLRSSAGPRPACRSRRPRRASERANRSPGPSRPRRRQREMPPPPSTPGASSVRRPCPPARRGERVAAAPRSVAYTPCSGRRSRRPSSPRWCISPADIAGIPGSGQNPEVRLEPPPRGSGQPLRGHPGTLQPEAHGPSRQRCAGAPSRPILASHSFPCRRPRPVRPFAWLRLSPAGSQRASSPARAQTPPDPAPRSPGDGDRRKARLSDQAGARL